MSFSFAGLLLGGKKTFLPPAGVIKYKLHPDENARYHFFGSDLRTGGGAGELHLLVSWSTFSEFFFC